MKVTNDNLLQTVQELSDRMEAISECGSIKEINQAAKGEGDEIEEVQSED